MKTLNIVTLLALLAAAGAVQAQTMVEDSDGDGVYSLEELLVVYPALTEDVFAAADVNGDGALDDDELTAAQEAGLLTT